MIGSLRGTVLERTEDGQVLLEAGGVGYLVSVTPRTLAELEPGSAAFLHVHHHIAGFNRLTQGFQNRAREFRKLVQKQDTVMRQ